MNEQLFLWKKLTGLKNLNLPWALIGDFNAITDMCEFRGGSFAYYCRKAERFSNFISRNNLLDANFVESKYTWCNNQAGAYCLPVGQT